MISLGDFQDEVSGIVWIFLKSVDKSKEMKPIPGAVVLLLRARETRATTVQATRDKG